MPKASPLVTNKTTFSVKKFAQSVRVPSEYFDDEMHSTINMMIRSMARNARVAREKNAWKIFNEGFTLTLTSDGVALFSDSHEAISGDTVDNKGTTALSPDSLDAAIVALGEQLTQDGEIGGHMPSCLVVPMSLYKTAVEITDSVLEANTADNQLNVFSAKYGISIYTSPWLGANAGGDDNNWFLLADNHSITRWVREGISTDLVDAKYSDNDTHVYKGKFREVVGAMNFEGAYGSLVA